MNNDLQITIDHKGAELVNIQCDGKEYLWKGDDKFWSRHAPILFPIVGRLANDTLRINGREYKMKQHGFTRDAEFILQNVNLNISPNNVVFNSVNPPVKYVMDSHGRQSNYPYDFSLAVNYDIQGNIVNSMWEVCNHGVDTMYFQIGAHPAFQLPDYDEKDAIHGYIQCHDENGKVINPMICNYLEEGLRYSYGTPKTLHNEYDVLAITNFTFQQDALLIGANQVKSASLFDKKGNKVLTVSCPQADAFGIWAPNKPGCPFVCIEPWCGIADNAGFKGDISERDCIHSLEPDEKYEFYYSRTMNS